MKYRIQKRETSSNIIERKVGDGKWIPFLAPLCSKEEGDDLVEMLLDDLESDGRRKHNQIVTHL